MVSTGECSKCNGENQDEGKTTFGGLTEADCLTKCKFNPNARGCEYSGTKCTIHAKEVSDGNGKNGVKCWTSPHNCKGKGKRT